MHKKTKKQTLSTYLEGHLVVRHSPLDFESWGTHFLFGCFLGFVSRLIVQNQLSVEILDLEFYNDSLYGVDNYPFC